MRFLLSWGLWPVYLVEILQIKYFGVDSLHIYGILEGVFDLCYH